MAAGGNDNKRDELVAVAAATLMERGVESTRFRDVADGAGVSIGLLQHYFGSRDELIELAIGLVAEEKFARLAESGREETDPWNLICAAIDEVLKTDEPIRDARSWLDICATASRRPRVSASVTRVQERWIALIEDAVIAGEADGRFEPGRPAHEVARSINAMIDGLELALSAEMGHTRTDAAEAAAIAKRTTWRIVGGIGDQAANG